MVISQQADEYRWCKGRDSMRCCQQRIECTAAKGRWKALKMTKIRCTKPWLETSFLFWVVEHTKTAVAQVGHNIPRIDFPTSAEQIDAAALGILKSSRWFTFLIRRRCEWSKFDIECCAKLFPTVIFEIILISWVLLFVSFMNPKSATIYLTLPYYVKNTSTRPRKSYRCNPVYPVACRQSCSTPLF